MGDDCIEQLCHFLLVNNYYESAEFDNTRDKKNKNVYGRVTNILGAHNGAKYDFRFIVPIMKTFFGEGKTIGGDRILKHIMKGIVLVDTVQMTQCSLKQLGKILYGDAYSTEGKMELDDGIAMSY